MTVRTTRFTPQALLSAPRRSAGSPNPAGDKVLYTTAAYSFDTHSKTTELRCMTIESGESTVVTTETGISDPTWINDSTFLVLKGGEKSSTDVVVCSCEGKWDNAYTAVTIKASASSLKIAPLAGDKLAVVVAAKQTKAGELYNETEAGQNYSSGRLYKSLFVRHWDEYETKETNSLWYTVLDFKNDKWTSGGAWNNLLKGKPRLETPIRPFGGADCYDVSSKGIIFVTKDPDLDPALNTKCKVFTVDIADYTKPATGQFLDADLPGFDGAASSPVFSPDGERAAYLVMRTNGYEADRNEVIIFLDVWLNNKETKPLLTSQNAAAWDRSPSSIKFSPDGKSLFLIAEEHGTPKLWALGIDSDISGPTPRALTHVGAVADVVPLPSGKLFVSGSSLVDHSCYSIIVPGIKEAQAEWISSLSKGGSVFGLSADQVSSIWTQSSKNAKNGKVHSWVIRPSFYNSSKKYPLAFLVHGGPQAAWNNSWSTRWNPAIFAEQGYIVVAPNPTGSTGYGQAFTDDIKHQWGGAPYEDLVNVFSYIEDNMPVVDTSRAVALGASYGGYMMNWINGHDLGRKFKALVNHDGIFSTYNALSTEELYFPFRDLGAPKWYTNASSRPAIYNSDKDDVEAIWRRNNPAGYLENWNTPTLVIHSSKDFRLPISEGLATFNVLQARGIESEFLQFSDENHWVLKPENSLLWHKVVLNWINRHVGLKAFAEEEADGRALYGGKREREDNGEQDIRTEGNAAI